MSNKPRRPQLNIDAIMGSFSPVSTPKAIEALQFYEDCVDNLHLYQTSENNMFDWDICRAYCSIG